MNHCVNCLHFIPGKYSAHTGFCKKVPIPLDEQSTDYDQLIWTVTGKGKSTGDEIQEYRYATSVRSLHQLCGLYGKLFELKPPTPFQSKRQKLHNFIGKLLCLPNSQS